MKDFIFDFAIYAVFAALLSLVMYGMILAADVEAINEAQRVAEPRW